MNTPDELKKAPSDKSLETAAQCWCDPRTQRTVMDIELATVFAEKLDEVLRRQTLETLERPEVSTLINFSKHDRNCASLLTEYDCNCGLTKALAAFAKLKEKLGK